MHMPCSIHQGGQKKKKKETCVGLLHKLTLTVDLSAYVPSFPKSHAKLKGPTAVLCAYTQARHVRRRQGYPSTLPDFTRKSIHDSRVWLLLALRLGRGDYNLIPAFPARTLGFFGTLQSLHNTFLDLFRRVKEGGGFCYERHACKKSLHIAPFSRAHQAHASFYLTVITSFFFLSRTELYVASPFFLMTYHAGRPVLLFEVSYFRIDAPDG